MPARGRSVAAVVATAASLLGILVLGLWLGGHPQDLPSFARDWFVADADTQAVSAVVDDIARDYYRPVKRGQIIDNSISGALGGLNDPFSYYIPPSDYGRFEQPERFSGIGIAPGAAPDGVSVDAVFDESPAARAGLRVGDVITAVNGRSLAGVSLDAARNLITGPPGTDVLLTVRRGVQKRNVRVTRETVTAPVVSSSTRAYGGRRFGVVALGSFSLGAGEQVAGATRALLREGVHGIVFDLRDNGGGLVAEARFVASVFIRSGVIVTTRGRNQPTSTLTATGDVVAPRIPLVVLVDRSTASASEIVTAALQDHRRALVVGTRTFGKGVFQEVEPLPARGAISLTVGEYYTPSGRNLGGRGVAPGAGVTPNVSVPDAEVDTDRGLLVALRALAAEAR